MAVAHDVEPLKDGSDSSSEVPSEPPAYRGKLVVGTLIGLAMLLALAAAHPPLSHASKSLEFQKDFSGNVKIYGGTQNDHSKTTYNGNTYGGDNFAGATISGGVGSDNSQVSHSIVAKDNARMSDIHQTNTVQNLQLSELKKMVKDIPSSREAKESFYEVNQELLHDSRIGFEMTMKQLFDTCHSKNANECESQAKYQRGAWQKALKKKLSSSSQVIDAVVKGAVAKMMCKKNTSTPMVALSEAVCEAYNLWKINPQDGRRLRRLFGPDPCDSSTKP